MTEFGYFISSEEHGPSAMVDFARQAEQAGFTSVLLSDHFHPWTDRQGQSPFVWSVIGAVAATTSMRITTGVTCPTVRTHPVVIAQAAATSQLLANGRFRLGVGSGERLNEHVTGSHWPPAETRLEMLEEAIEVLRELWTGEVVTHYGIHYTVENARLYSCPEHAPEVLVSGFGPKSVELAARVGDGYVNVAPEADAVRRYRGAGGTGPCVAGVKVCWGEDEQKARALAHEVWRSSGLPGELNQELAMPRHFEQASELVTEDMVAEKVPCGPDPERHAAALREFAEAGFDEVFVSQVGDDQAGFLRFFFDEVKPRLGA